MAFFIGLIGGLVYAAACKLMDKLGIDDPLEASQVHGFTGIWGTFAVGFFSQTYGLASDSPDKGKFFFVQLLGIVMVILFIGGVTGLYFSLMRWRKWLRVSLTDEIMGLDIAECGSELPLEKETYTVTDQETL